MKRILLTGASLAVLLAAGAARAKTSNLVHIEQISPSLNAGTAAAPIGGSGDLAAMEQISAPMGLPQLATAPVPRAVQPIAAPPAPMLAQAAPARAAAPQPPSAYAVLGRTPEPLPSDAPAARPAADAPKVIRVRDVPAKAAPAFSSESAYALRGSFEPLAEAPRLATEALLTVGEAAVEGASAAETMRQAASAAPLAPAPLVLAASSMEPAYALRGPAFEPMAAVQPLATETLLASAEPAIDGASADQVFRQAASAAPLAPAPLVLAVSAMEQVEDVLAARAASSRAFAARRSAALALARNAAPPAVLPTPTEAITAMAAAEAYARRTIDAEVLLPLPALAALAAQPGARLDAVTPVLSTEAAQPEPQAAPRPFAPLESPRATFRKAADPRPLVLTANAAEDAAARARPTVANAVRLALGLTPRERPGPAEDEPEAPVLFRPVALAADKKEL